MRLSRTHRALVRRHLVQGRLRPVVRGIYAAVVGLELAAQRGLDAVLPSRKPGEEELLGQLTAVVKTFERPQALKRLLDSIQRLYPDLKVIVVDDSACPTQMPGVETVVLPYDSGVSAGRREGLHQVTTRYMLNLDDDFVLTRHTDLNRALSILEAEPQIDILGGQVVNLPLFTVADYGPLGVPAETIGGLPVYDKVANFFVGRTERLRLVDWDPALKRVEHADFFRRARGVLTTVFNAELKCLHAPTPFDAPYMAIRTDVLLDSLVLRYRQREGASDEEGA